MRFHSYNDKWINTKIKTLLKIKSGQDQKAIQCDNGLYNIYGTGGIIGKTNKYLYNKESVGIGRKGTIDRPFYFSEPFWTVDTLFYSEIHNGIPKFIYYLFQTINWNLYNQSTGVPSLTSSVIENINVYIPNEKEQLEISNFLSIIDMRIETQKKIIEDFKLLIKALNDNHFNDIETYMNFKKLYLKAKEGGTPDTKKKEYYYNGNIPFIKIDDLNEKYITKNDTYINADGLNNSSAWIIPSNSVIYSNGATIGEVAINIYPISTKQGILGIVPNENIISEYLYYLLKSKYFRKQITKITTKGTMEAAYLKDIDNIKCPIEAINVQKKYVKIMNYLTECLDNEKKILLAYEKQKQYLLNHMFI